MVNALKRLVTATKRPGPGKREAPQVPRRHNALRHSFCSYRLADVKSAAQVVLEAGDSPQGRRKHSKKVGRAKPPFPWLAGPGL